MKRGMVYQRGAVWWIKYYRNGKPFFESSKSTKKMVANELLKTRLGEAAAGKLPGVHFEKVTFEELIEILEADYRLKDQKRPRVENLKRYFKGMKVVDISTTKIKEYIAFRRDRGGASATINRELSALKRMFRLGAMETPPKVDRVPYIPMLREDNIKQGFLESDQYLTLLSALPSYLRPVLTFGYRTGWRINEIRNLTWNRVDMKERTVELSANMTKNRQARAIWLDDDLLKTLQLQNLKRVKGCDFVFHRDGRQVEDFRKLWNKACRQTGLGYGYNLNQKYVTRHEEKGLKAGPTFHDLRRSAARNLIRSGVGRDVAKCITGHKTDSVFSRYNITSQDDMREAALKQQAYLSGQEN